MIKIDCDLLSQSVINGIEMRTNISILLRFPSPASTMLVIFEEWEKGTPQNTVVGENKTKLMKLLSCLSAFQSHHVLRKEVY